MKEVHSHYEVNSGDYLVHLQVNDRTPLTFLCSKGNEIVEFGSVTAKAVEESHNSDVTISVTLVQYDSPLRQKKIKEITIQ